MDACDQSDVDCPMFGEFKPKDWDRVQTMKVKMGSVLIHGSAETSAIYHYPVDSRIKKGADFWCTVLTDAPGLHRDERLSGRFPPTLYIQCDSAGDNKNYTIAGFAEYLVRATTFHKVKVSFLPVGHTHEDIDAVFGRLSRRLHSLKGSTVNTWADCLLYAIQSSRNTRSITPVFVSCAE